MEGIRRTIVEQSYRAGVGHIGSVLSKGHAALAAQLHGSDRRVFVIASDAELNEGSTWEAAMFAAQHRLGNLALLVDLGARSGRGS